MADVLKVDHWQASGLRVLVVQAPGDDLLAERLDDVRALADRHLNDCGAILLRGFGGLDAAGFGGFAAGFGRDLLPYDFASTPRRKIESGVYSSTEYPAHQWIPQHNEQSYTRRWPMKIWFFCDVPPGEDGATPISNSRAVHRRLDAGIRARFDQRRLMYVRNYGRGLDLPWEEVFQTSDRAEVENFCRSQDIAWEWLDDGALRTCQVCQSEMRHPVTGEAVWFNQAHLFHVSGLEPAVREALLDTVDEEDLPCNVVHGDGTPIEDAVLDEIRGVQSPIHAEPDWRAADFDALAADYVRRIRQVQPDGPYHLLGWSHGGLVAAAMARRLEEAGDELGLVGLIDTVAQIDRNVVQPGEAGDDQAEIAALVAGIRGDGWQDHAFDAQENEALRRTVAVVRHHHALVQGYALPRLISDLSLWWAGEAGPRTEAEMDWQVHTSGRVRVVATLDTGHAAIVRDSRLIAGVALLLRESRHGNISLAS